MRKSFTLLIMIMMLITSVMSYHIPVFAEEEDGFSTNEEETISEFLEKEQEEDEEDPTLIFEEEDSKEEEGEEEAEIPEEEEVPAEEELPVEEGEEENEFADKDEAVVDEEMAEEIEKEADELSATGNPNNWPFRVVGSDGSLYLVIGQADDDNWLKDAYRKAGSHVDFIDGSGNVVASYTVENTTRQNKVYLDNFYFYGHNHGLKIDVRKLVDDKLPAGTYKILVHVEGYTDYIAQNVNIKSLASSMTNEKALLLSELCVAAPNDITVTANSDGDIIINSKNKTFLQALAKRKVEYQSFEDTTNGIPKRIVYIGGGFISLGGVDLQNTGTTILSHDDAKNYHVPDDNPAVLAQETVYEYDAENQYVVIPNESITENGINDGTYTLTLSAEGYQATNVTATLNLCNPARQLDPSKVTASVNSDGGLVIQCSDPNEGQDYLENLAKPVSGKITSGGRIMVNGQYIYNTANETKIVLSGNKVTVSADVIKELLDGRTSGSTEFTLYSKSFEAITRSVNLPYIISSDGDDGKAAAIEIPKTYIVNTTKTVSWSVYDSNNQLIPESDTSKLTQEKVGNNGLKITAHEIGAYTLKAVTDGVTDTKEIFASAEGLTISAPASVSTYLNAENVKMEVETKLNGTLITVPLEYKVEEGKEYCVEFNDEGFISFYQEGTVKITASVKGMPELNATTTFTVYKYDPSKDFSFDLYTRYLVDDEEIVEEYDPDRGMEVGDRYIVNGKVGEGDDAVWVNRWDMIVKSSSTSIASVTGNAIRAQKVGNATITVEMTDLGKKKKATMPIKVVNKIFNELFIEANLPYFSGTVEEDGDVITVTVNKADVDNASSKTIELYASGKDRKGQTVYDLSNIKYASNNTAVATVSSKGVITIKGAGYATIDATMSDNASLSKSIVLRVVDPTPKISTNKATLNKYKENGEFIEVHAAFQDIVGANVDHVELEENTMFGCRPVEWDPESYEIYILDGMSEAVKSGKHTLTVYMDNGDKYNFDFTITVTNKLPSVTVQTGGTYDSFRNEGWLYMSYYSKDYGEWIEDAEFVDEWASFVNPEDKFEVKLKDAAAVKSGTVRFYFYGYTQPVEKKVSFKVTSAKPKVKLRSSSVTIYAPEGTPAEKEVLIALEGEWMDTENDILTVTGSGNEIEWDVNYGNYATAKLTIRDFTSPIIVSYKKPEWSATIDNKLTIKVNSTLPTAKLKTSSVTAYAKYTRWVSGVIIENSEKSEFKEMFISGEETPEPFSYFALTADGYIYGQLKEDAAEGSYKVVISPELKSGVAMKPVTLTVKVDKKTDPKITLKPTTLKFNKNHTEYITTEVTFPKNFDQFNLDLVGFAANPVGGTEDDKLIDLELGDYYGQYVVSLNEKGKAAASGKYVHEVWPVFRSYDTGLEVKLDKPIKLTVNISDKAATFKGTMKGNFNPLSVYRTTYATFKYSNVVGTIKDIKINENACPAAIKGAFEIEDYWPGDDIVFLTMTDVSVPDGSYVLPITLVLEDADSSTFDGELKVTVKRQAPKVTTSPKTIEVFDTTNNRTYYAYLQMNDIYGTIKDVSAYIDKDTGAYTIDVDNGGYITVTLVDASKLKTGSTQTAVITINWEGDLGPKLKTTTLKLSIKDVSNKIKGIKIR